MEISSEADGVSIFCEENTPAPDGMPRYFMEGTIDAAPGTAAERLRTLLLCVSKTALSD